MKHTIRTSTLALLLSASHFVDAATIIDTGAGGIAAGLALSGGQYYEYNGNQVYSPPQYLAGQFNLLDTTVINSISGWIMATSSGDLTIKIYDNTSRQFSGLFFEAPGTAIYTNTQLVNDTFLEFDPNIPFSGRDNAEWIAFNNLGWALTPGTYWVAFEVANQSTFSGAMPGYVPAPLNNYAGSSDGTYYNFLNPFGDNHMPTHDLGIRIEGEINPVPLPSSLLLFLSGLLTFSRFSNKQNQKKVSI